MSVIERYRLGMWPDGTIAAFTDGDRAIAGRDLTVLRLVKAEDYDALAEQFRGAVEVLRDLVAEESYADSPEREAVLSDLVQRARKVLAATGGQ
jgi:hypothetical protein